MGYCKGVFLQYIITRILSFSGKYNGNRLDGNCIKHDNFGIDDIFKIEFLGLVLQNRKKLYCITVYHYILVIFSQFPKGEANHCYTD
jgi:hypothetical protein